MIHWQYFLTCGLSVNRKGIVEKGADVAEMTSSGDDGISPEKGEDHTEMTSSGKYHSTSSGKGEDGAEIMSLGEDHEMCHKTGEVSTETTSVTEDHGTYMRLIYCFRIKLLIIS